MQMVNRNAVQSFLFCIFISTSCTYENTLLSNAEFKAPFTETVLESSRMESIDIDDRHCYGIDSYDSLLVLTTNAEKKFLWIDPNESMVLGEYIYKGRGTNELVSPIYSGEFSDYALFYDLSQCRAYLFTPQDAFIKGRSDLIECCQFPPMTTHVIPAEDNNLISLSLSADELSLSSLDLSSNSIRFTYSLAKVANIKDYITHLSLSATYSKINNSLAVAQCYLPFFTIINNNSQKSITSLNKTISWEEIRKKEVFELNIYYQKVCTVEDYYISLFINQPITEWQSKEIPVHFHIFDSDGDFIADITVNDYLKDITYNHYNKKLYGLGYNNDLYVYDLTKIRDLI